MANVSIEQQFIRSMQKKYQPKLNPHGQGPLNQGVSEIGGFSRGRATGNGMDNELQETQPAGVVHEGEFVVSAPDVRNAGGPEKLNAAVEESITHKSEEIPGFQKGGYVRGRGYQAGGEVLPEETQTAKAAVNQVSEIQEAKASAITETSFDPIVAEGVQSPANVTQNNQNIDSTGNVTGTETIRSQGDTVLSKTSTGDLVNPKPPTPAIEPREVTPTEFDPDSIQKETTERAAGFEQLQDDQIQSLQDIASGQGMASGIVGQIARNRLAGQISSGNQAAEQGAAQSGLTGGELAAFRAKQRRDTALAQTGLEGQLAIDAVNRAENATLKLADIAQQGQAFEEAKAQFGANFDLSKENFGLEVEKFNEFKAQFQDGFGLSVEQFGLDKEKFAEFKNQFGETLDFSKEQFGLTREKFEEAKSQFSQTFGLSYDQFEELKNVNNFNMDMAWKTFGENIRQFDAGTALQMFLNDTRVAQGNADALLLAGDIEGAASIYKDKFGIDADFSVLQTRQSQQEFGNAIANLSEDVKLLPDDFNFLDKDGKLSEGALNSTITPNLIRSWNSINPENMVTKDNAGSNEDFLKYSNDLVTNIIVNNSPIKSMLAAYDDDEKSLMLLGSQNADGNPFFEKTKDGKFLQNEYDDDGVLVNQSEWTFVGSSGPEALDNALTYLQLNGGLSFGNGEITPDYENSAWSIFGLNDSQGSSFTIDEWNTGNATGNATRELAQQALDAGEISSVSSSNGFTELNQTDYLKENPSGWINIDGELYQVGTGGINTDNLAIWDGYFYVTNENGDVFRHSKGDKNTGSVKQWEQFNYDSDGNIDSREVVDGPVLTSKGSV